MRTKEIVDVMKKREKKYKVVVTLLIVTCVFVSDSARGKYTVMCKQCNEAGIM